MRVITTTDYDALLSLATGERDPDEVTIDDVRQEDARTVKLAVHQFARLHHVNPVSVRASGELLCRALREYYASQEQYDRSAA